MKKAIVLAAICLTALFAACAAASDLPSDVTFAATVSISVQSAQSITVEYETMPEMVYHWDPQRSGFVVPAYAGGGFKVTNSSSPDVAPCFSVSFTAESLEAFRQATGLTPTLVIEREGQPLLSGEERTVEIAYQGAGEIYKNGESGDRPYAAKLYTEFLFWMDGESLEG